MVVKDPRWAVRQLRKYLNLIEKVPNGELTAGGNPRLAPRGTPEQIAQQKHVCLRILEELFEGSSKYLSVDDVQAALVELQRGVELSRYLGDDDAPALHADGLHKWVWSAAAPHWDSEAYGAAVWAAAVNVNSRLQTKLDRHNLGESKLIQEALSLNDAEPGKPRLRLCDRSNPDLFKDLHVGAMNLGVGLYAAVPNPLNHVSPEDYAMSTPEALESLAAFSLFARWVSKATVERAAEDG